MSCRMDFNAGTLTCTSIRNGCCFCECRVTQVCGITFLFVKMKWSSCFLCAHTPSVTKTIWCDEFYTYRHVSTHRWGEEKFVRFCRLLIYIECDIKLTKITYKWNKMNGCCFDWNALVIISGQTESRHRGKTTVQNNTQSMQLMSFPATWLLNWLDRDAVVHFSFNFVYKPKWIFCMLGFVLTR